MMNGYNGSLQVAGCITVNALAWFLGAPALPLQVGSALKSRGELYTLQTPVSE